MSDIYDRPRFESWIMQDPFARSIDRWPDDATKTAWPGQYKDYAVELAWCAWQEALLRDELKQ